MDFKTYLSELSARYNAPTRAQSAEITQLASDSNNPSILWERIRTSGLIPKSLLYDQRRTFVDDNQMKSFLTPPIDGGHLFPSTRIGILTISSDTSGILQAETNARELCERLIPWGAICNDRIIWYITNIPEEAEGRLGKAFFFAQNTVILEDKNGIDVHSLTPDTTANQLPYPVRLTLACWQGWEQAANSTARF